MLYRVGAWLYLLGSFLVVFLARALASAAATAAMLFFLASDAFFLAASLARTCVRYKSGTSQNHATTQGHAAGYTAADTQQPGQEQPSHG